MSLRVESNKELNIDPHFSEEKLKTLLRDELDKVHSVIKNKYPRISLYRIQPGRLYHWGSWYGTTLQYTGNDNFNDDTLRVILQKKNSGWEIVTDPPSILLNKHSYPGIPIEILRDVNSQ